MLNFLVIRFILFKNNVGVLFKNNKTNIKKIIVSLIFIFSISKSFSIKIKMNYQEISLTDLKPNSLSFFFCRKDDTKQRNVNHIIEELSNKFSNIFLIDFERKNQTVVLHNCHYIYFDEIKFIVEQRYQRKAKENGAEPILIIINDIYSSREVMSKHLNNIIFNKKYLNLSIIIQTSNISINPCLRFQYDYLFLFPEFNKEYYRFIWKYFRLETTFLFENFLDTIGQVNQNQDQLVMEQTNNDNCKVKFYFYSNLKIKMGSFTKRAIEK